MKLSIIIPLYNKELYIERCLKSVIEQDLKKEEYEIIIIDDGSLDSGAIISNNYSQSFNNINLIYQENAGPSVARNNGFNLAKGKYVYFLDADDFIVPNVLGALMQICENYELDVLEFDTRRFKNSPKSDCDPIVLKNIDIQVRDGISYVSEFGFKVEAWRFIVKKDFLQKSNTKFIEGTLYEDAIFSAMVFLRAKKVSKINYELHRYNVVENSIATNKDRAHNLKFIKGILYAVEQYDKLIQNINNNHKNYFDAVNKLKSKKQELVFAFLIRFFKFRLLSFKELKSATEKFKSLETYPLKPSIGGIPKDKINYLPLFNNPRFLFTVLTIKRFLPF